MVTKQQAINAYTNTELHQNGCHRETGPRGGIKEYITRARVSGACKTWKREPERWRLPLKHGMYQSFSIGNYIDAKETSGNPDEWHLASECSLLKGNS